MPVRRKDQSMAHFLDEHRDLIDSNGNKISDWCKLGCRDKIDFTFTAYCVFCNDSFTTRRMTYYILQHAKSLRHRTVCDIKSSSQNDLEDNLENDVNLNVKSCSVNKVKPSTIKSPLSKYEMMLEEKRAKNREFLKSLGINEAKSDLVKTVSSMKKTKVMKPLKRSGPVIQRTSKRQKENVDYAVAMKQNPCLTEKSFKKALKFNTNSQYESFVKDFSKIIKEEDNVIENPVLYNKDNLRQLSPKATSMRIYNACAMSWFPSSENLVLAVGDANGNLNLSNFKESYLDFHVFSVHSERISDVQYSPFNPFHLISSGIDGRVLCCDLQAQKFNEVLNTSGKGCTYFDFISPSSYLVSLTSGQVLILDTREYGIKKVMYPAKNNAPVYQKTPFTLHDNSIRALNIHPTNKNYFVTTAKGDNKIYIWDLRFMTSPVIRIASHKKNVVSATFSPVSGKFLLSKSFDEIGVFECASMTRRGVECRNTMKYDFKNNARLDWLPNSDDIFACSIPNSSLLHIFDKDLNVYETLSKDIPGFKSHITFHPFKAALACATSSNKICVYS